MRVLPAEPGPSLGVLAGLSLHDTSGNTLFSNLYTTNDMKAALSSGEVSLAMQTNYPWDGVIRLTVNAAPQDMTLALRKPGWCRNYTLKVNGEDAACTLRDGFLYLSRGWAAGDCIELAFDMPVMMVRANPRVAEDLGKVAVQRGPVVYCLEEPDNGKDLQRVYLSADALFDCRYEPDTLGGIVRIETGGYDLAIEDWDDESLYDVEKRPVFHRRRLRFIPYYAWANRGPAEMTVWVHEKL